jgi:Protein of unknown function (DUF3052)
VEVLVNSPQGLSASVDRLGLTPGELILEVGYDSDCDDQLRLAIEAKIETTLLTGHLDEVVDAVILWWRDGDGDLVDDLVDGLTYLSENGPIWLLTPKVGIAGHVEPSDIQDAAPTAGLTQTVSFLVAPNWTATKLVPRKSAKR